MFFTYHFPFTLQLHSTLRTPCSNMGGKTTSWRKRWNRSSLMEALRGTWWRQGTATSFPLAHLTHSSLHIVLPFMNAIFRLYIARLTWPDLVCDIQLAFLSYTGAHNFVGKTTWVSKMLHRAKEGKSSPQAGKSLFCKTGVADQHTGPWFLRCFLTAFEVKLTSK